MTEHIIFGAGLIGGYLAGVFKSQGLDVGVVARESVRAKLAEGLHLTDYMGNEARVSAPKFDDLGTAKCLWLTVKCTAVDRVLSELEPYVDAETRIFCCQNGLGSEASVKKHFPNNEVLRVMVQFNVVEEEPAHLHRSTEGPVSLESLEAGGFSEVLANQLDCGLLPVHSCEDMKSLLWAKLQLNLGNGVNALADIPIKAMLEQRDYRRCFALLQRELLAVTEAKGIKLPKITALPGRLLPGMLSLPNFLFLFLASKMLAIDPNARMSMWWDLSQGKNTEVDFLNGAVVEAGEALGIACPANKALVALIRSAETGKLKRGISGADMLRALTQDT